MAKAETIPVLEFPQARGHVQELPALDRIRDLALAWKQAQDVFTAWHKQNAAAHTRHQYGTEIWVRMEVEKTQLINVVVETRGKYERACDDFFLRESEQSEAAE